MLECLCQMKTTTIQVCQKSNWLVPILIVSPEVLLIETQTHFSQEFQTQIFLSGLHRQKV